MQRVALYGTLVIVLNAAANLLHTISHARVTGRGSGPEAESR